MKQVLIKKGQAIVEEVPAPQVEAGKVLVKTLYSCISVGTEMSGVRSSGVPLWKRALKEPEKVKKVLHMIASDGLEKTQQLVKGKLESGSPVGYSAAGIVLGVGEGISDVKVGDRVACAGAQCAHHAEVINVPRNLLVKIPDGVSFADAAPVTLGAIAMQGVRRAQTTLGETFVVIGLGVIGQIAAQLLKAAGCRVIVSDLDASRVEIALQQGADLALQPDGKTDIDQIARLTGGVGADGVIITAATQSNAVVSTAFQMCRRKGRVILVGDVGLHLNRADFYAKEIDFLISTSYGPGRYDVAYEERGLEYPIGYVRWTENRNMQEVLRLVEEKKLRFDRMVEHIYPVAQADEAYASLQSGAQKPLMLLLAYPAEQKAESGVVRLQAKPLQKDRIQIGIVGAGGFAKGMHLPNLAALPELYQIRTIMSRTAHNAMAIAKQYGADYAATNYQEVLDDASIDMVLLATRHHLHADMALQALTAGKHVLVEKPLALTEEELARFEEFYAAQGEKAPLVLTGFNRRYSPYLRAIHALTEKRSNPLLIQYRMNAGYIPLDHWVHGEEGGGRNIGEACHIYDLFNFLTGAKVKAVQAASIQTNGAYYSARDNFIATISYEDGSIANLLYTASGAKEYPKEHMEIFFDGKTIVMEDYRKMYGLGFKMHEMETKHSEKGQKEEIIAFAQAIKTGGEAPIPFWQQLQAMRIAFAVEKQL